MTLLSLLASATTSLMALLLLMPPLTDSTSNTNAFLDENSVVLITGAAGFLGSELAMALHRVYSVKKIIAVDSLQHEDDLAVLEFKRQRLFHMLQTCDDIYYYRVDFRPVIPEFFDSSEVPVLHHIFTEHPDISHVVHLAADSSTPSQVVPRTRGDQKAGMMESLLEELLLFKETDRTPPTFVYGSSTDVYSSYSHEVPFREEEPLTTPTSILGASKVMDELLASAYRDSHDIASVALRYSTVYGPWGNPASKTFELAEQAVAGKSMTVSDAVVDHVFVDDAIDATLAAMQIVVPSKAIAINIGGSSDQKGHTLREFGEIVKELVPGVELIEGDQGQTSSARYASLERAKILLGYEPQVSFAEGIKKTLAWHYDRAFPYGTSSKLSAMTECSRYDNECLRGTAVFPCASECANPDACKSSLYDDVLPLTRIVTMKCDAVLYTVVLDQNLTAVPSANYRVSARSVAHMKGEHCNLAFVSLHSPLYQTLAHANDSQDGVVKHGFWSLIPVAITDYTNLPLLNLLPKISPSLFFGEATQKAVYCDPDIIFDDIPRLLKESDMQPLHKSIKGATAMLIGKLDSSETPNPATRMVTDRMVLKQDTAYRAIRMAVIDEMMGDGFAQTIDSSFIVHALGTNDARLFRCDVLAEIVQWQVETDHAAVEFILGLHDMWSRVMVKRSGTEPWWIGSGVSTVHRRLKEVHRRLEEGDDDESVEQLSKQDTPEEHNGFGVQEAIGAVFGFGATNSQQQQQRFESPEEEDADDFVVDDDDQKSNVVPQFLPSEDNDPSSYDVWMGVLSSTQVHYFSRMVPLESVGAYRLDADPSAAA